MPICTAQELNITTTEGVTYRKTQDHLKPYQPQCKKTEDEHSDNNMQTLEANHKQFDSVKSKNNQVQYHSGPKRDINPQLNLICDVLSGLCNNKLDISYLKQIAHKVTQ